MDLTVEILQDLISKALIGNADAAKVLIPISNYRDQYLNIMRASRPQSEKILDRGPNKGKKIKVDKAYVRSVEYTFNKLIEFLGDILITQVDFQKAESFILDSYKSAPYIASQHLRNLRAAFNKAQSYELIKHNPFQKLKIPKIQKSTPAWVNPEEMKNILVHAPAKLKMIFLILFYTGMRAGELVNLIWKNINIPDRCITIGNEFITKTKTTRVIPVSMEVQKILIELWQILAGNSTNYNLKQFETKPVFSKSSGHKYTVDYLSKEWKKAVRAAGADERLHLHSLRHAAASLLVANGASLYHVQKLLGHSTIQITQQYSHLAMDPLRQTIDNYSSVVNV